MKKFSNPALFLPLNSIRF